MIILQFFTGDTFFLPIAEENWRKETRKLLFHLLVFHTKYLLMHFAQRYLIIRNLLDFDFFKIDFLNVFFEIL